jgi:hypothetical protein
VLLALGLVLAEKWTAAQAAAEQQA